MTGSNSRRLIYDLDMVDLREMFSEWKEPPYRTHQVWEGLYMHFWNKAADFTTLPKSIRQRMEEKLSFNHLQPVKEVFSSDRNTQKTLFHLPDNQPVEAVLMRYHRRKTVCISTQSGCAMGCVFCATGQMGFRRHLSSGEIVEQVLHFARHLSKQDERVTNIVFMGMGEPFHNYEATMKAIGFLNHAEGLNIGARNITVSTVGLVPAIRRFSEENSQVNLSISLHAMDDELRSSLLPVNLRYPLDELFRACLEYVKSTNRRLTFEWALISGLNDNADQAEKLAKRLQIFPAEKLPQSHVNIIPLNPTKRYGGAATSRRGASVFKEILNRHGIPCTIRVRRGIDIQAGCGQLAEMGPLNLE